MNALNNNAFRGLLSSWRRREDVRMSGDIRELAKARAELDLARARMYSIRG